MINLEHRIVRFIIIINRHNNHQSFKSTFIIEYFNMLNFEIKLKMHTISTIK